MENRREFRQGQAGIFNLDGGGGAPGGDGAESPCPDNHCNGATAERVCNVVVAVRPLARHGNEDGSRGNVARIKTDGIHFRFQRTVDPQ